MNIHTQQTDCEAEIAAGARGLGGPDTLQLLVGTDTIHLDEEMATAAKLPNCCQEGSEEQDTPKGQGGAGKARVDILGD